MSVTKNAEKLNRKANRCKVVMYNPNGVYRVKSPSGNTYTVDLGLGGTCTCEWGQKGGAGCSHEMAARKDWERRQGRKASFQAGDAGTVARKQHKAAKPVAAQGADAVTLVLRDALNDADQVWAAPMPEIHSSNNWLLETDTFSISAHNDGECWSYTAHRWSGKYRPQVGHSFERKSWFYEASRAEFDRWFEKVRGA